MHCGPCLQLGGVGVGVRIRQVRKHLGAVSMEVGRS